MYVLLDLISFCYILSPTAEGSNDFACACGHIRVFVQLAKFLMNLWIDFIKTLRKWVHIYNWLTSSKSRWPSQPTDLENTKMSTT